MTYLHTINRTIEWMEKSVRVTFREDLNLACGTLICTYTESLGAHLRGCQVERGESQANFTAFVRTYLQSFMQACRDSAGSEMSKLVRVDRSKIPATRRTLHYPEILYKLFRCGFAHEQFSKAGTAIVRDRPGERHPYLLHDHPRFDLVINLSHWVPDFMSAVQRYKEDVLGDHMVSIVTAPGQTSTDTVQQAWEKRGEFLLRE